MKMCIDRCQVVLHISNGVPQLTYSEFIKVDIMQSIDHISNLDQRVDQFIALYLTSAHSPNNGIHLLQVGEHRQHTLHIHRRWRLCQ